MKTKDLMEKAKDGDNFAFMGLIKHLKDNVLPLYLKLVEHMQDLEPCFKCLDCDFKGSCITAPNHEFLLAEIAEVEERT